MLCGLFSSCREQGPLSSCCTWVSQCNAFSCCGAQALGHVSFFNCGSQALGTRASVAVVHKLSCPLVWGIFPDQGRNPCPLHFQADSFFLINQLIDLCFKVNLFLAVLDLCCYAWAFSSCHKWGILFVAEVNGLLIEVVFLVAEHGLSVAGTSGVHRLRSCSVQT